MSENKESIAERFGMTEKEFEVHIQKFVDNLHQGEINKVKTMVKHGEEVLEKVFQHLRTNNSVDDEGMLYFPENYSFTSEEYHYLFDTITEYLDEEKGHFVDEDSVFENRHYLFSYKEEIIELFIMWGQGTAVIMSIYEDTIPIDEEEDFQNIVGDLTGYKKYIEKRYEELTTE